MAWPNRAAGRGALRRVGTQETRRAPGNRFRERHAISDALFAIVGGVFDFRNPQNVASVVETARQVEDETGETLAERP